MAGAARCPTRNSGGSCGWCAMAAPISIRDIDEEPVEKTHLWASRKPSKPALQRGFFEGRLAISARTGMLKTYELMERHFGWERLPAPATERPDL